MKLHGNCGIRAFTLVEAMIAAAVTSIVLAGFVFGSTALMRSFSATEDYSSGINDQTRILDYIGLDVKRALSASVSSNPTKITLTVQDQYSSAFPNRTLNTPILTATSVTYGSTPTTISYFLSGSAFIRQENGVPTTIAASVADFVPSFDNSDPKGKTIQTTITFMPIFRTGVNSTARAGTTITNRAVMRN